MLNIGAAAPPPAVYNHPPPQPGSYQRPRGPAVQTVFYQAPRGQGPYPSMPGSYPGPPPPLATSVPQYSGLAATAFVPLQVITI